jgi:UrcA family protein
MALRNPSIGGLCASLALAGFTAIAAAPALAQEVDEITVVGSMGRDGRPETLSRTVSFSDLDLATDAGADELRGRIRATARDLCRQLGETGGSGVTPSCVDLATRNALGDARVVIAQARSPGALAARSAPAPYVAPVGEVASAADETAADVSATVPVETTYTTTTITNGPVPDTAANRARFGGPLSNAGQRTTPAGN